MIGNIIGLLVLVGAAVLFGWLARRAGRSRRGRVKWPGVVLAGLLTLVFAMVTVITARGLYILYAPRSFPVPNAKVAGTPDQLARGEHLAAIVCASCHSPGGELPLAGGRNLSDDVDLPLGALYPPNLTPAGDLPNWSDGELLRAIHQGTHRNGRPLVMGVQRLQHLSDDDAQAVVAYLRRQPAVQNRTPETSPSLLLAIFLGAGLFNIDAQAIGEPVLAPPKAATAAYGAYIVNYSDCRDCHGEKLDGHPSGPVPPGPNLRTVASLPREAFVSLVRTRAASTGTASTMPWKQVAKLDDEELAAMHLYLSDLAK